MVYIGAYAWTVTEKSQCSFVMPKSKLSDVQMENSRTIIGSVTRPLGVLQRRIQEI